MSTIVEEMVLAHSLLQMMSSARRVDTEVLGGKSVIVGEPNDAVTYVALANSWIITNVGGGPPDDKPTVTLEKPPEPDRVSSFLNIRVADSSDPQASRQRQVMGTTAKHVHAKRYASPKNAA